MSSAKWRPFCLGLNVFLIWKAASTLQYVTRIILCMGSANERKRYNVTPSLFGRARTQNGPGQYPKRYAHGFVLRLFLR